jgi:predicted metal-binding protein
MIQYSFTELSTNPFSAYLAVTNIDGRQIKCSAWRSPEVTTAIVVGLTRMSEHRPAAYGYPGLFRCAQRAVEASANHLAEDRTVLLAIPRTNTSSRLRFFTNAGECVGQGLHELCKVLNATQAGRAVYFVSVGLDAFTTELSNLVDIAT